MVKEPGISEEMEEIDRLLVGRKEPGPQANHYRSRPLRCASARENYFCPAGNFSVCRIVNDIGF